LALIKALLPELSYSYADPVDSNVDNDRSFTKVTLENTQKEIDMNDVAEDFDPE
jgi:hypothetical protein